jgi:hypothetical protein
MFRYLPQNYTSKEQWKKCSLLQNGLAYQRFPISYRLPYWTRDHDTQYIYTQHTDTHHNDSQHDNKKIPTLNIMTLIIIALYIMSCYTKYHLCYMMFMLIVKNKLFMLNVVAPFTHCRHKLRLETASISSV